MSGSMYTHRVLCGMHVPFVCAYIYVRIMQLNQLSGIDGVLPAEILVLKKHLKQLFVLGKYLLCHFVV